MSATEWLILAVLCAIGWIVVNAVQRAVEIERKHQQWIDDNCDQWEDEA